MTLSTSIRGRLRDFPKDASQNLENEATAWARSLEFNGGNGFTMP